MAHNRSKTTLEEPARHATRQPPTQMTYTRHPASNRFQGGSAAMPGKKPKAGFPGWGLNPRIVTDPSIALTRSDFPDTHPSAHQTHPNLRRRSAATVIHHPKPKPSSVMPSESKQNRHKAGFSGLEGSDRLPARTRLQRPLRGKQEESATPD